MITDEQILENIKELNLYCLEHQCCEGCIFKPVNYKPVENGDSLTKKVDSDELLAYFVEEYFDDDDNVRDILSTVIEEGDEPFDLLMDDWDDLFETAKNIINNK